MINLTPELKRTKGKPLYEQLYTYIKESVEKGAFLKGDKLPSIRTASSALNLSKTTVIEAYDQLLLEGYIESKDRSGYFICTDALQPKIPESKNADISPKITTYNDMIDKSFNEKLWANLVCSVIRDNTEKLFSYGEVFGESQLRNATVKYLKGMRGVTAQPYQVIIGAGMNNLASTLTKLLPSQKSVAFEYPGFNKGVNIFEERGFSCTPIPLKNGELDITALYDSGAKLVFVTPSHQYPTGSVMSASVRRKLIEWARQTDAYIIEDDYDSVLRFHGRPISALQGYAPDRVIHFGSFSKLVIPAMRISYMVLPEKLSNELLTREDIYMQSASVTEQLALAKFIDLGYFERHIRKIRKVYSERNELITKELLKNGREYLSVMGNQSGFHILLKAHNCDTAKLKSLLLKKGIRIELTPGLDDNIILLYYSGIYDEKEFVSLFISTLKSCKKS